MNLKKAKYSSPPTPLTVERGQARSLNISHKVWRSHCGVVMQESFIFSDSIAKNIAVGRRKMDMDKLRHAAEVANVREFIESLPLGYNTKDRRRRNRYQHGTKTTDTDCKSSLS